MDPAGGRQQRSRGLLARLTGLSRQAQFLNLEATAQVLQAFVAAGESPRSTTGELAAKLWDGLVVRLHQGREIYGGLQDGDVRRNGLILPSETRTVSEITRAVAHRRDNPRFPGSGRRSRDPGPR